MTMARLLISIAATLAALAVGAGAFASHALRGQISDRALEIFETATRYQMYHALAMLLVGSLLLRSELPPPLLTTSVYAFGIGIFIFSGSLYALSLSGVKWLGAITPVGGVAFILGWLCLALAAWRLT